MKVSSSMYLNILPGDATAQSRWWKMNNKWPRNGDCTIPDLQSSGRGRTSLVLETLRWELSKAQWELMLCTGCFPCVGYGKTAAADMCKLNFPQIHASALRNKECKSGVVQKSPRDFNSYVLNSFLIFLHFHVVKYRENCPKGFGQLGVVKDVPPYDKGVGIRWSLSIIQPFEMFHPGRCSPVWRGSS